MVFKQQNKSEDYLGHLREWKELTQTVKVLYRALGIDNISSEVNSLNLRSLQRFTWQTSAVL